MEVVVILSATFLPNYELGGRTGLNVFGVTSNTGISVMNLLKRLQGV